MWFSGWLWFGLVSHFIYIEDMNISPVPGRGSLGSHLPTRINIDPIRFDLFLRFFLPKKKAHFPITCTTGTPRERKAGAGANSAGVGGRHGERSVWKSNWYPMDK